MLSVFVVGSAQSGKTRLCRRLYSDLSVIHNNDDFVEYSTDTSHLSVIELKSSSFEGECLGKSLARRTIPAVVVALPRDEESSTPSHKWAALAKRMCPLAKLSFAVTKSDIGEADRRATRKKSLLSNQQFEGLVYDAMQNAETVDRLFYTSSFTDQGVSGLRCWLDDVMIGYRTGVNYDEFGDLSSAHGRAHKYLYKKKKKKRKTREDCQTQSCDNCKVM